MVRTQKRKGMIGLLITAIMLNFMGFIIYFFKIKEIYEKYPLVDVLEAILYIFILSLICFFSFTEYNGHKCLIRVGLGLFYINGNALLSISIFPLLIPIGQRLGLGICAVLFLFIVIMIAMNVSVLIGCTVDVISTLIRQRGGSD